MTGKSLFLSFLPVTVLALLAGCGTTTGNSIAPAAGTVPVSLSITDDPPAGVSVLFFQVSLTAATLTPASAAGSPVSLLSNNTPIQIDVTQLQAFSDFLSTANVAAGTYNSMSLTFGSPELVIFNASDTSIASSCAVGTICQIAPTIDNSATVNFTSAPFPVTVSANNPLGFLVDFHLNTVIQSDLSVNLGVANGVTIAELPSLPSHPRFGTLTGEVGTVNTSQNQFTLQTAWGRTFTIDTTSSTTFDNFPTSACTTAGIGCLSAGQIVQAQIASVGSGGVLTASQVTYVQAAGQQTAEGTIIRVTGPTATNTSAPWIIKLILHKDPANTSGLPLGGEAEVTVASNAMFSVDANGFTIPSGLSFTSASDLYMGQEVRVDVVAGSLSSSNGQNNSGGWGPPRGLSFTTDSVGLEPSQITGMVTATDSTTSSFTLSNGGPFFAPWPMAANAVSFDVDTTSQTTFDGFNPESFAGIQDQDLVSAGGWLFAPASSGAAPTIVAQGVVLRFNGMF